MNPKWIAALWLSIGLLFGAQNGTVKHGSCGVERWAVKTLQDPQGSAVYRTQIIQSSVPVLTNIPAHPKSELLALEDSRLSPWETTVYEVHAVVIGFKHETDQDFHIVIADPQNLKDTMIVEIPAGECVGPVNAARFAALQAQFEKDFGHATAKFKTLPKPVPVDVVGVGFFDFIHGQTGVAPNGFELHPVLAIGRNE